MQELFLKDLEEEKAESERLTKGRPGYMPSYIPTGEGLPQAPAEEPQNLTLEDLGVDLRKTKLGATKKSEKEEEMDMDDPLDAFMSTEVMPEVTSGTPL